MFCLLRLLLCSRLRVYLPFPRDFSFCKTYFLHANSEHDFIASLPGGLRWGTSKGLGRDWIVSRSPFRAGVFSGRRRLATPRQRPSEHLHTPPDSPPIGRCLRTARRLLIFHIERIKQHTMANNYSSRNKKG